MDYLAVFILWFDLIPQGLDIVSNLWDESLAEEQMTKMVKLYSTKATIWVVTDCYLY